MKLVKTLMMAVAICGSLSGYAYTDLPATYDFSGNKKIPADNIAITPATIYTDSLGYGYDFVNNSTQDGKFFFSVNVPDGNYLVTVRIGSKKHDAATTIRGESRRLFANNIPTKKGETKDIVFLVNKHTPVISDTESVKIKPREKSKLNWDDKLTVEINGENPAVQSITIAAADGEETTVFLCGDSTVVDQDEEPWGSWGQMITSFFDNNICIANYAESGESANTFIAAGRLKKALSQLKAGDYLFIEFGHNDQKQKGPGKGAFYSYMTSLKTFIDEARNRGANPVLVTPTMRRSFGADGKIQDTHLDYPDAMRFLAERENVPIIDLNEMTRTLYEALGPDESIHAFVHYPAGTYPGQDKSLADNTHFNAFGAYQIARCVATGMQQIGLQDLIDHLTDVFVPIDLNNPDDWRTFHWDLSPFMDVQKPDGN